MNMQRRRQHRAEPRGLRVIYYDQYFSLVPHNFVYTIRLTGTRTILFRLHAGLVI